ncbi:MAG: hypothetical protein EZS28_011430 [Streblomastix strix]|uniref:Uncharacterized protein n=1 Tax=Streblomastix strix TaxID=222440 RepID=A0A5J4WDK1_9EUKA|nr:MAG: hypothetical protein EZS28_011430 [Streblomastix strix]
MKNCLLPINYYYPTSQLTNNFCSLEILQIEHLQHLMSRNKPTKYVYRSDDDRYPVMYLEKQFADSITAQQPDIPAIDESTSHLYTLLIRGIRSIQKAVKPAFTYSINRALFLAGYKQYR